MVEGFFTRLWNAIKPPPAVTRIPRTPEQTKQRKWVMVAVLTLLVLATGYGVYRFLPSSQQRADSEFKAGMKLMEPGNYNKAIAKFDHAARIRPNQAQVYLARGIAHRSQNEIDLALDDFDKAIELDPTLAAAHIARGGIFRERGDINRAMAEYIKSIQLEPTVEGYYQRGQLFESLGEHRKAIEQYDQAIALLRNAPHVYWARSLAKRNLGDIAGARADRAKAQSIEKWRP